MSKKLLLINDLPGYGKVALAAMIPVLTYMKYELYNLPTAIVSNTLDYGVFDILDTTQYMRSAIRVWDELGFEFDAISTGFIASAAQAELVADYCRSKARSGCSVFTDPIMGDEGALYNGVGQDTIGNMRRLIAAADYIVPNYTEAAYLADAPYRPEGTDEKELIGIIDRLRDMGAGSVVITSAKLAGAPLSAVLGYDAAEDRYFQIDYEEIPVRFPGTGDIFSAVFLGHIMNGMRMEEATERAMHAVREIIRMNLSSTDRFKGLPIETCLEVLQP